MHIQVDHLHQMVRATQTEILNILSVEHLVKVHRSYIANIQKIMAIHPTTIEIGDEQIPVQKELREELLSRLTIM